MDFIEIASFFTSNGNPSTHLGGEGMFAEFPIIRIWEINESMNDIFIIDGIMTIVEDNGTKDGFYKFIFSENLGFNPRKKYLIRTDGGDTVDNRYQTLAISNSISSQVWDYVPDTTVNGSAGALMHNMAVDLNDINDLIKLCVKYNTNRTKIDISTKTLSVYDNDGITILRKFNLLNSANQLSIDEVAERLPVFATDGQPIPWVI